MFDDSMYTELIRVYDPIEADLLAAFLGDGDIDFFVVNRSGVGLMSPLMPRAASPICFQVQQNDLDRGKILLDEYRRLQSYDLFPDAQQDLNAAEWSIDSKR